LTKSFLQVVRERTVEEYLGEIAKQSGFVLVAEEGGAFQLTTPEKAAEYLAEVEGRKRVHEETLRCLQGTLSETGSLSVQDFLDLIQKSGGLAVLPTEEAWESDATIEVPPGGTLRQGLDALKSRGLRWAVLGKKLFILK
jgi:hypothetical protein